MERYYDLNGREKCITAIIRISDMSFRISRVVIGARVLYSNHLHKMSEMLERLSSYNEERDPEGKEAQILTEEANSFAREKLETYERIIRLILEKNGYSYDSAWWDENTDEFDRRRFIELSMMKDSDPAEKKKENPGK